MSLDINAVSRFTLSARWSSRPVDQMSSGHRDWTFGTGLRQGEPLRSAGTTASRSYMCDGNKVEGGCCRNRDGFLGQKRTGLRLLNRWTIAGQAGSFLDRTRVCKESPAAQTGRRPARMFMHRQRLGERALLPR